MAAGHLPAALSPSSKASARVAGSPVMASCWSRLSLVYSWTCSREPHARFFFSLEDAVCEDSCRRTCRVWPEKAIAPALASVRILTGGVLDRENERGVGWELLQWQSGWISAMLLEMVTPPGWAGGLLQRDGHVDRPAGVLSGLGRAQRAAVSGTEWRMAGRSGELHGRCRIGGNSAARRLRQRR